MRKIIFFIASTILLFDYSSKAQTTGMDFNITDCNGNPHHLFSDLDAGNSVILEFFMISCSPCITAGQELESMKSDLLAEFPGKIKAYAFGFNNTYTCTQVNNWITSNGFTSIPSDSGATQVAYYGGMGMPTIVILGGGTNHSVLGTPYIGFSTGDTITMASNIRNFLNSTGIKESAAVISSIDAFPNPVNDKINLTFEVRKVTTVNVELIDLTGRVIAVISDENLPVGKTIKSFDTKAYSEGNYFIKVSTDESVLNKKITIVH